MERIALEDVFAAAGGMASLAAAIGVHRTTLYSWTRVPAERVFQVAKATGIEAARLRPDLFHTEAA
jgi:DNA-binding transcriptional regulator YdaS (Cro superfamily)